MVCILEQHIHEKGENKSKMLENMQKMRAEGNNRKKVQRELFQSMRISKVNSMRKMQAYQKHQLFEKIMEENERTGMLLHQRCELQHKRKMANMQASIQRQLMNQLTEKLKNSANIDTESISLDKLSRPNTS